MPVVSTSRNTRQQSTLTQPHPRLPWVLQASNHTNLVVPPTWVFPIYPWTSPRAGKFMTSFHHTFIGLAPICDVECKVNFTKHNVIIYEQEGSPILTGWRERNGVRLWRIALTPTPEELPDMPNSADHTNLKAYRAYDLPSVESLVRYLHTAVGFPVRTTLLKSIKMDNYRTWPGLTLANATAYFPSADETIKGHIVK